MANHKDLVAEIASVVETWSEELIEEIRESLHTKNRNASESLSQSFRVEVITGEDYATMKLRAEDYYMFPDRGRRAGHGVGKMVKAMSGANGWIAHKKIQPKMSVVIKRKSESGKVSTYIKKYKNINEANKGMAWAIAISIKNHGYKAMSQYSQANYYTEVVNSDAFLELRKRIITLTANPNFIFQFIDPNQKD